MLDFKNRQSIDRHHSQALGDTLSESQLRGKRILVTGAAGFIGGYLVRRLASDGADVVALEHTPGKGDDLRAEGINVAPGDIRDSERMAQLISQDIEIVVHAAAWLRGLPLSNYRWTNVEATRSLAQLSARAGVERFVFVSSIAVYGPHADANVDENAPLTPYGDPYGDSKIACEGFVLQCGRENSLPLVIVRPGMVYGPGSQGWTVRMIRLAKRGLIPLVDGGRGTAYPVYIDNLIDLLVLCAKHSAAIGQVFNGVDDGPVLLSEFLGAYMGMARNSRALRVPGWLTTAAATIFDPFVPGWSLAYLASQLRGRGQVLNEKAKGVLGWSPRIEMDEGMRRSEAWLCSQGLL